MQIEEYHRIDKLESVHFWYRAMDELTLDLLKNYTDGETNRLLDAGCGTGGFSKKMEILGEVTGVDINDTALVYCRKNKLTKAVKASILSLPFPDNFFDIITCLDVIYHKGVSDDISALKEMHRVLKPGGLFVLRVPAFELLRGNHDKIVQTRHRYTAKEIKKKIIVSNFKIIKLTYANMILSLPVFIKRTAEKLLKMPKKSDLYPPSTILNELFYNIMKKENILLKRMNLPFGSSIICLARKENQNSINI